MAQLFSRWESGTQVTAGTMVGSVMGASGLNVYADRLNSITTDNSLITGSMVSGTSTCFIGSNINALSVSGTNMNVYAASVIPGGIRNYSQDSGGAVSNVPDNYNTSYGTVNLGHNSGDLILVNYSILPDTDTNAEFCTATIYRAGAEIPVTRRHINSDTQLMSPLSCQYIELASTTGSTLFDLRIRSSEGTGDFDRGLLNGIVFKV